MKFIIKANRISEAIFFLSLIYTPIYQNNFFEVIKVRFNVLEKKLKLDIILEQKIHFI